MEDGEIDDEGIGIEEEGKAAKEEHVEIRDRYQNRAGGGKSVPSRVSHATATAQRAGRQINGLPCSVKL